MRVLGIDPASAGPTGYGVIETQGRACSYVECGVIPAARRGANGDGAARLREIHARITSLLEKFSPDEVAVESIFTALNVKTALKLAEVRGVVLLAAAQAGVPVHSYSPREVKLAVTGYGHADKHQMQQMVRAELELDALPQPADAADALAVALCHVHAAATRARMAAATGGRITSISAARKKAGTRTTRLRTARIQTVR
jgi:crossover junction endodeoxyribonuclease RuvC